NLLKSEGDLIIQNVDTIDKIINFLQCLQSNYSLYISRICAEKYVLNKEISSARVLEVDFIDQKLNIDLKDFDNLNKLKITIDYNISSQLNAKNRFDQARVLEEKREKTLNSFETILKKFGKNNATLAQNNIKKNQKTKPQSRAIKLTSQLTELSVGQNVKLRKKYWFESFHWFISSENVLVVGGKNASQNDQLVKRYLKKGDKYIHADVHGASSIIVKTSDSIFSAFLDMCQIVFTYLIGLFFF
ncbi:MAG: hypothetical protein MHPSP_002635, partial [Paramarteilia canceri]